LFTFLRISGDVTERKSCLSYSSLNELFWDEVYCVLAGKTPGFDTGLLSYYFFRTLHCFSSDIIQVIVQALVIAFSVEMLVISILAQYK
jgi:hypothetical protein